MIVMMLALLAIVFAQRIQNRIVCGRNLVNDAFFYKGLQGAVNSNPVKAYRAVAFNVRMRQGSFRTEEEFQNFFSAFGYT